MAKQTRTERKSSERRQTTQEYLELFSRRNLFKLFWHCIVETVLQFAFEYLLWDFPAASKF